MSILGYATKKVTTSVMGNAAEKMLEKEVDKFFIEKSSIGKFEFDNHLWIERQSDRKNSESVVLDEYGNTKYIVKRNKYNSNNPKTVLLDNNKSVIC